MRRLALCALSLALTPTLTYAEINITGKSQCKEFAIQQLKEIKQDYYGALTRDEKTLVLEVAESSCLALYDDVEEERAAIQLQPTIGEKVHWWEKEGKVKPNIKKAQQSGGK